MYLNKVSVALPNTVPPEVTLQSLVNAQFQATTGIHHVRRHTVTGAATLGSSRVVATCGELGHAKEI